MAIKPRKIPELSKITSISDDDLFIVEQVNGDTSSTVVIEGGNLRKQVIRGPYANDVAADNGGVEIGQLYYTADGSVKVRLT